MRRGDKDPASVPSGGGGIFIMAVAVGSSGRGPHLAHHPASRSLVVLTHTNSSSYSITSSSVGTSASSSSALTSPSDTMSASFQRCTSHQRSPASSYTSPSPPFAGRHPVEQYGDKHANVRVSTLPWRRFLRHCEN
ncbi:hypothetical protein Taro_024946 [Colocasia esculenta]|uniref:Uncharacterized protein n=1 Tax=Colocasia esculenta TaxID=4460 RepID=A0A843VG22_COLES|nr:hypothetical protein [Colocasia esculenta]